MARAEERNTNSNKKTIKLVLSWTAIGVLIAVAVTLLTILIVYLVKKNKPDDEEKTFDETYPTAELIDLSDLALLVDNNANSGDLYAATVYVYVYSPDYETYPMGNEQDIKDRVNECIDAYSERDDACAFYVVNVTTEDNKEYLASNSSFLTDNGIDISNGPCLVVIGSTSNGLEIVETYVTKGEIVNHLVLDVLNKKPYEG